MAYVAARRKGRFEIRESLHTPNGPRARSLASFQTLTDDVLATAAARATRPFDIDSVIASAQRAGASVTAEAGAGGAPPTVHGSSKRFVQASRRMALAVKRAPSSRQTDPGTALIDLLGFADAVARSQPPRPFAPLTFPVLSQLMQERHALASPR